MPGRAEAIDVRLMRVEIRNFKRFVQATVGLDSDVIAIVGPNEAGKTSLLEAIGHLDTDDAFPEAQLSRGVQSTEDDVVVSGLYLLEDRDLDGIDLSQSTARPRW